MRRPSGACLVVVATLAVCPGWASLGARSQAPLDLGQLLARVGERVAGYYRRAQHLVCVERSTVQPLDGRWGPDGFARSVESELRVELEAGDGRSLPAARVVREVRRINGRAPLERDKKARDGCTDPNPMSPEPLGFLLPSARDTYRFTAVREGREKDRAALVIDFESANLRSRPELVEEGRHDQCFDWSGPVAARGRVWVDAAPHHVLRVDRRLPGPVDVRVPWPLQRRYLFGSWVVIERDDLSLRYKTVAFTEPDEVVLVPESIDTLTVLRGGLQSTRRSETFSNYRRFLTAGRVVKER